MRACEPAGPLPSQTAWCGASTSSSDHFTLKFAWCRQSVCSTSEAVAQRAVVDVPELAVDRHPVAEVRRVHDHVPDPLGRGVDLDRGASRRSSRGQLLGPLPVAQRALDGGVERRAGGRRTRRPRASSRGSRSCSSDSISGPISAGSSPAIAAATTEAIGVSVRSSGHGGAADHQRVGDPGDHVRVGHHVRAADVPRPAGEPPRAPSRRGRGSRARRGRRSARCGCRARPAAPSRACARSAGRGSGTSASGRR